MAPSGARTQPCFAKNRSAAPIVILGIVFGEYCTSLILTNKKITKYTQFLSKAD
jgi:hypothetical protein